MKKSICLAVTVLMAATMVGCGLRGTNVKPGESAGESVSATKTTLRVATYDGGVGDAWLKNAAKRFEEFYKDTEFEPGKKGVQVKVLPSKSYNGETMLDQMQGSDCDVFFTETVNYYDHVNANNFADITDAVTKPLTEFGEEESIEDKIDSDFASYLKTGGKYYGIPFYEGIYGIMYNKDVFEKYNLYFKRGATPEADKEDVLSFAESAADAKSAGPDGVWDTYDDGLPATYAQMRLLCAEMRDKGIVPFSYAGSVKSYPARVMMTFWADAEGAEQMMLNYELEGTATDLVASVSNGKIVTESKTITTANAYELQKQVGKYYALDFMKNVVLENTGNYVSNGNTHLDAQSNFIKGNLDDRFTTYAMHFDGSWWENEADSSFKTLAQTYGSKAERANSNFGFMPVPKPTKEQVGEKTTLLNQANSLCFVRATTGHLELAKAFVRFTSTDVELSAFTAETSMTRAFSYELSESDKTQMSNYAKSLYEIKSVSDVVNPYSVNETFMKNSSFFALDSWSWTTSVNNGSVYSNPFSAFLDGSVGSVKDYFDGLYTYYSTRWNFK